MKEIKAVLFDLDGTLLDTREYVYAAYNHVLNINNYPQVSPEKIDPVMGIALEECYRHFTGVDEVADFCDQHRNFQLVNSHLVKKFEDTSQTLDRLKDAGLKLGVVTTRSRSTTDDVLSKNGLTNYFETVIAKSDVVNLKPHPESILKALSNLNVDPIESIMIGDTDFDIQAGKAAGASTIGVTYGYFGTRIADFAPDHVAGNMREIARIILQR